MPCLVLTGHPCVGKTEFAKKLRDQALQHKSGLISSVTIVNEEVACVDQTKSECYVTSHAEKSTRSSLKARVDRSLTDDPSSLVICDSLNYIKGYRYELHCLSKATGQKHGVIWILNSSKVAQDWNQKRSREKAEYFYTEEQMKELIMRFEPPDARNRWDKPLWRVDLTPASEMQKLSSTETVVEEALKQSVYNMHDLSEAINTDAAPQKIPQTSAASTFKKGSGFKESRPYFKKKDIDTETFENFKTENSNRDKEIEHSMKTAEEQINEILDSFLMDVAPLKQGLSTQSHVNAQSNVLHDVDSLTSQVCNAIVAAESKSYSGSKLILTQFGEPSIQLACSRHLPLTELKRLRKQYVRWVAKSPPQDTTKRGIIESFVKYVEIQVN
mmetsp:Transcript_18405/g.27928  ORF Transcript_18405/g.27928 Transcript_18405/m.27928 type:complete len:386 (+) Transcript_18405:105-1262(+)